MRERLIDFLPGLDLDIESAAADARDYLVRLRDLVIFAITFDGH